MIYLPNKTLHGNFKYYEVFKSRTADRLEIDNIPKGAELDNILEIAEQTCIHILQPVRDEFGSLSPSSWFRCEKLEKAITAHDFENLGGIGKPSSFFNWMVRHGYLLNQKNDAWSDYFSRKSHPKGEAVDFEKAGVSNIVMFDWCKNNLEQFDQLIAEFVKPDDGSAGWIHGSNSATNRKQILEIK